MTYDHDGKLIRFDLNGKRVSGTVVKTHDRRHVTVRGRSGKTVKVDMLDQHGVVALPSGLEVTTIWNADHPPLRIPPTCDPLPDRQPVTPKPKAKAQPTTTKQLELL